MNVEQVRDLLRERIAGNQTAWAKARGLSQGYVSDLLSGRREPGEKIMRELGLERIVIYRETA